MMIPDSKGRLESAMSTLNQIMRVIYVSVLHCDELYCNVIYCTVLYCTVL
jgi:hypothetical protein